MRKKRLGVSNVTEQVISRKIVGSNEEPTLRELEIPVIEIIVTIMAIEIAITTKVVGAIATQVVGAIIKGVAKSASVAINWGI